MATSRTGRGRHRSPSKAAVTSTGAESMRADARSSQVHMERRKVQITGGSTFIVSLPKRWVDQQGLQPGQPVDVHYEEDGPVTVYPVKVRKTAPRTIMIEVERDEHPMFTVRRIISAYLAGFETITVRSDRRIPTDYKQTIRQLAQTLIGIEIVEETANHIVLQDLLDPADFDLAKALGRMHQLSRAMVADAIDAFHRRDVDLARDVLDRDPEVDRLDWMIKKQFHLIAGSARLAAELGVTAIDAHHHLLISHALERIADHATRLSDIALDEATAHITDDSRNRAVEYGRKMLGYLDDAVLAFQTGDVRAANLAIERCKQSKGEVRELFRTVDKEVEAQMDLALAVESLERIRNYTMDVAEVAIDHVVLRLGQDALS